MSDLEALRTITRQLSPPAYDDLAAVARKRRRHSAIAAVGAATVAVLIAVGVGAAVSGGGPRSQGPVDKPTGTPSSGAWTPDRIRAEGVAAGGVFDHQLGTAPAGLDAELYCVGEQVCDPCCPQDVGPGTGRWALEMTHDDRSVVFEVRGKPWARYFGEDSILVQDGSGQSPRFRLVRLDGSTVQLHVVDESVPAAAGPDVVLIDDLDVARSTQVGPDDPRPRPYAVDVSAGTIRPLAVPAEVRDWAPNVDAFLWGANGCRVVWQRPDGRFDEHQLACRPGRTEVVNEDYLQRLGQVWAAPGRMVLLEHDADGALRFIHVTRDYGASWDRIEIANRTSDGTTAQIANVLVYELGRLG